jgi:fumarate reductase subunit D
VRAEGREQSRRVGGLSTRAAPLLAWSIWALSIVLVGLGLVFQILNLSEPSLPIYAHWAESMLLGVGFPTVGAIIASRRTHNPIGWLLCASGLVFGVVMFASEYAIYTLLVSPGTLPAGEALASVTPFWVLGFNLFVLMLILFPTGQLPRSRWRWVVYLYVAVALAEVVAMLILPGTLEGLDLIENPLGIEGLPIGRKPVQALVFTGGLVASATLISRLRRGSWVERQQIKWLAYAAAASAGGSILTYTPPEAIGARWVTWIGYVLLELGVLGIPISIGIAISRYRLYEIDTLINRTLVYGSLTVLLAVVYFGGVTATEAIVRTLTGQEQQPQLAVVVSTLVIAALFNPLRRRIQAFTDKRFYRSKYDARKTLESFSAKLRDETDLDALSGDLTGVVRDTMQPAHVSLWLRPETAQKGKQAE